jgi:Amidohydrolase family/Carbohydrate binding domain (family 11)
MRVMTDRRPLTRVARGLGMAITAVTAGALWMARPSAQPRPPIAIVGARIVDGSGNEAFTGTIVVSGGRISAVGRQVEPPADAERIDGTGKTVLPGFIETAMRAPLVEPGDAGRRLRGLALAAGVTTAAVPDGATVPAGAVPDAGQPRLLAAVAADSPGRAAAPPPNVRELRNGTLAVSLADDPPAGVAAVRSLNARIAFSALVREDGGLDVAAATASGLTPLEAVTAMTGSGAWALGLQSDRGLLAPSMRADLVLVAGDPTVSFDALAQVERVFLGGVDVDRAALRRPPPEPAAPTAAAGPAVPPAATPPASSKASAPARSRARGGKGARAAPPPATAAAPAPAATDRPPASPAAPAPDTAPDAAPTAPAATVAPIVAGVRLRDPLLDDFERGDTVSAVGPAWVGSGSDGAGSATTLIMGRVVKGLRDHALLVSARMGGGPDPYARAALKLDAGDRPIDVSRFRGLRFDARGEGRYRVVFVTRAVDDGRYHQSYFSGSPLWTPVSIPFASIGQNGAGTRVPWTGRDVVEVRFEMVRDAGRLGWLELDNVTFY